ncbi:ferrochelatase [Roseomonas alkaliterrae]|uniref:Ferrochelatase n=1 Tax=Neoroseomonas alkaliterrae TaxID=1452450 RepID=A0A840Y675_9PROT|nr:ferrochelatase [Neoroseomonas alkaliterrae]MBB5691461.1 ferrochelatase [Neoroseomonas alkaliterrae]MBR0675695.1 ferrochelatase [Neoroseomonas alkaliterrae]
MSGAAMKKRRVAIVLFNLGGPDRPESVRPFLVNLFTDPAILRVPGFLRPLLGRLIAWRRTRPALENYAVLGGRSPLLELTEEQARALQAALAGEPGIEARCFIAMRYWHPMSEEAARAVQAWAPDEVLLLPLYPQYSTTTTGSSIAAWEEACRRLRFSAPTTTLCCWHSHGGFAAATAALVREAYAKARAALPADVGLRVLFSAHGLPESIVTAGDPYQWQVERSVEAVVQALAIEGLDHVVCYQSRVTPQKWIGPSTEEEIERAAHDKVAILVCPIAFVSEHSETLVELDVEYREEAEKLGVPGYFRVPAQNSDPAFIAALADLARAALGSGRALCSFAGARQCPKKHGDCPHARAAAAQRESVTEPA